MWVDTFRMLLGILIMALHRPLASFVLRQEHSLHGLFRARGMHLPHPPSEAVAHNIYFVLGLGVSLISAARIWVELH